MKNQPFKNVLVLEPISKEALDVLNKQAHVFMAESPEQGELVASRKPVHAIVTAGKGVVNQSLIQACRDLKVIASCGDSMANIDTETATRKGIKILTVPGSSIDTHAEHTLGLMLALQRRLVEASAAVREGNWNYRKTYKGDEISGKTLGILGMDHVGHRVSRLAQAFGMKVIYWDRMFKDLALPMVSLEELYEESDIISIHLPFEPDTRHLVDSQAFEKMKPSVRLINTSHGAIIDEQALVSALQNRKIAGFAADVLEKEPPREQHPLTGMRNTLLTPRIAGLTKSTYSHICRTTIDNVLTLLYGKEVEEQYVYNFYELIP